MTDVAARRQRDVTRRRRRSVRTPHLRSRDALALCQGPSGRAARWAKKATARGRASFFTSVTGELGENRGMRGRRVGPWGPRQAQGL